MLVPALVPNCCKTSEFPQAIKSQNRMVFETYSQKYKVSVAWMAFLLRKTWCAQQAPSYPASRFPLQPKHLSELLTPTAPHPPSLGPVRSRAAQQGWRCPIFLCTSSSVMCGEIRVPPWGSQRSHFDPPAFSNGDCSVAVTFWNQRIL